MTKQEINNQIDKHFQELRQARATALKSKLDVAMQNEQFASLEKQKRALECDIAKAMAFHTPCAKQQAEYAEVVAKRDALITALRLDLTEPCQCELCQDHGWIDGEQCVCRQKYLLALVREKCSLAPMPNFTFADNKFNRLDTPQTQIMSKLYSYFAKFCANFDTTPAKNFLLLGDIGIGKTSLACAVANQLLAQRHTVFYITAFDMNNLFLDKHLGRNSNNQWAYDYLFDCEMLIIDDLGTEPILNRVSLEYLFALIDSRINYGRKILISSNLTAGQFQDRYGGRLYSRLTNKLYYVGTDYIVGGDLRKIKSLNQPQ
ncbi:MAG: ATP-binding protein [Clostridia bacterium]